VTDLAAIAAELARRTTTFRLENFCADFPEQLAFIRDPARFKVADCSRRAGKTVAIAADLVDTAIRFPGMACLYLTLSRLNAKRILWRDLLAINTNHGLGGKPHETELTLTMPNGHVIYLSGAKDKNEVEKYRGFPLKKVYIDEAQSFRPYIEDLVDDVLTKSLYDYNGALALTGTPPPVPVGYFHDAVHSGKWSRHSWTMLQNPHLKVKSGRDPMDLILEDCERMGVGLENPKIQRECFGRWVRDTESLVLTWGPKNDFDALPDARTWNYVLGVDLGFSDADALACIGWPDSAPHAYLVEESVTARQGITELVGQIEHFIERYNPQAIVMDTGGLGKKIAEELRRRYALPIKAAEKVRKYEFLELLNDALRTGRFFAKKSSHFCHDSMLLEWDREKCTGDKRVISESFHSDIIDAALYAYREALHWLHVPEKPKSKVGTTQWMKEEQERMEAHVLEQLNRDEFDPVNWKVGDWDAA
jgi:hypothetical protein